jgi:hypothetical protein
MTHRARPWTTAPRVAFGAGAIFLMVALCIGVTRPTSAGATTDSATLSGEGGTFLGPVVTKLMIDAKANLGTEAGAYIATGLDQGITDFVGSAPNSFNADFDVSERPLTSAEAGTATTDGRTFAYVPFSATPVAIGTLVTDTAYTGEDPVDPSHFCPHIQLTVADIGAVFGLDTAQPVANWADPRFACSNSVPLTSQSVQRAANADPTMANYALMALMDSDPTAKGFFQAGLSAALATQKATTQDPTPSENWPYTDNELNTAGGDQPFLGKLLNVNATTNVPSIQATVLGNTFPISSVWTGVPLGAAWNIPTAAIQNAAGKFVAPSTAAAAAAEADATMAKTSDPTTNNLVTFNPSTTDAAAYNSFMMEESYLVVPTNGLPANKASALAGLIRFVLGPDGQRDISSFGAAPATAAMDTAGLQVAGQLDAEVAQAAAQAASTTSTTTASTTPAGAAAADAGSGSGTGDAGSTGSGGGGAGSGSDTPGLAFTGAPDLSLLIGSGAALVVAGAFGRRFLRRRRLRS